MRKLGYLTALGLALALGWTGRAQAQAEHYANRPYELELQGGAHFFDDADDTDFGIGARFYLNQASGLGFGGSFTWVFLDELEFEGENLEVNGYLYSGEVTYTFPAATQLHPFVGAGIGAITVKISDVPEPFEDSETELLIPLFGGIKWFNRTNDPNWAIRAEVRDNIIFIGDEEVNGETFEGETTNNFEISAGVSFLFGG